MTNKQTAFVIEYVRDWNATQAAIRAGYSPRTANRAGHRLLTKVDIQAAIGESQTAARSSSVAKLKECCQRLTEIIRANLTDFIDERGNIDLAGKANLAAVQEIVRWHDKEGNLSTRLKLRDPTQAMTRLAAFLGLDKPKQLELDVKTEVVVPDTLQGMD
jgi:phage terminase small subunit